MRTYPLSFLVLLLAACAAPAERDTGIGGNPSLPAPQKSAVPTVNIAPAQGWPAGRSPVATQGLETVAFATGLDHPRWLLVLPNGDVLVAESNAPVGKSGMDGVRGQVMKQVMTRAGAGSPSADRITLLRDVDGDGRAEVRHTFAAGLTSPFGMALVGDTLYVANADALVATPYQSGDIKAGVFRKITDLPGGAGQRNHHWTKSLVADKAGRFLYVGVGSNSNVGENGMAAERDRAAILRIDPATGDKQVHASGLRNPVGMDWEPATGQLWTVVNERDELGNNLVPDYLTSVREGGFYGWPWWYWGTHADVRAPADSQAPASALRPDYGLGNHVAPLGLTFSTVEALGGKFGQGAFVALHGSWNRKPMSGYKVIFVPFDAGKPKGMPMDVLSGFLTDDGKAMGRPVGVAMLGNDLLVADDVGNAIWRVRASKPR